MFSSPLIIDITDADLDLRLLNSARVLVGTVFLLDADGHAPGSWLSFAEHQMKQPPSNKVKKQPPSNKVKEGLFLVLTLRRDKYRILCFGLQSPGPPQSPEP